MKKIVLFFLLFFIIANIYAKDNSDTYFPVHLKDAWYYQGYKKNEPEKIINVKAEVIEIKNIDGKDYYYYSAPDMDMRYFIRKDTDGAYMRIMKYPFPIFNFSIEIDIIPEMKTLSFPLFVGKKWEYEGQASTVVFVFFKITRDIKAKFEVVSKKILKTPLGEIESYNICSLVDEGDGKGFKKSYHWYGKNIGYILSDTPLHYAKLTKYESTKNPE